MDYLLKVKYLVPSGLLLKLVTNSTCIKKENHYLLLILTITYVTCCGGDSFRAHMSRSTLTW